MWHTLELGRATYHNNKSIMIIHTENQIIKHKKSMAKGGYSVNKN